MSQGINRVVLFGNLGVEPELRATQGGQSILKLRLATTEGYLDKDKNFIEKTEWHDVTVFGPRAEGLSRVLNKGDRLLVEGSLRYSSYEKDGITRYRSEIVAREVCLAGRRRSAGNHEEAVDEPYAETLAPAMVEEPPQHAPSKRNGARVLATS
ncbi:MAG: single-stranded DNA-binding protein [Polyangiaceae bacterium]